MELTKEQEALSDGRYAQLANASPVGDLPSHLLR